MSFALFVSVVPDEPDSPVKVRPERVFAITQDPERVGVCELHVPGGVFIVRGTVDEVSAALEAAGAPPVAPAVEVAPTDLKLAAWVLDVVSAAIIDCDENDAVDDLSSTLFDSVNAGGHTHIALTALAARLRGAR